MITINSLNEWFNNLIEKEKLNVLAYTSCCDILEAKEMTKKELIYLLFSPTESHEKAIVNSWEESTNREKLDMFNWYNDNEVENSLELLDSSDYENYVTFLERIELVEILGLDMKLHTIFTFEHLFKCWNDLSENEKAAKIKEFAASL